MPARIDHKFEDGKELKWCSKCRRWLELNAFHTTGTKSRTWDGLFYACIECENKLRRNNPRRQAMGVWNDMVRRVSENPRYIAKGIKIRMKKEAFLAWYIPRHFRGCLVDRIDNNGHYQLDNLQLLSRTEHNHKARQDHLDAIGIIEPPDKRYCYGCKSFKEYSEFSYHFINGEMRYREQCKQCYAAQVKAKRHRAAIEGNI